MTTTDEQISIYDKASTEIVDNRVFNVTATGGEPLAVLKQAYPYLKRLTDGGVGLSFNTNLTMFTKEKPQLLKDLGVRSVLTSLMSEDPELNDELANRPNTHHDVTRGIRLALDEGFGVLVNMVVTKKNLHDIYATAEYVKSLGVKSFSATKASTPINSQDFGAYALSPDEVRLIIQELVLIGDNLGLTTDSLEFYSMCAFYTQEARDFTASRTCTAGKTACTIGFDGQVRPCSHAVQTYGSVIKSGGLKQAWSNMRPWRTDEYIPTGCSECSLRNLCRGGCRSEAFVINGSLDAPDPYCDYDNVPLRKTLSPKMEIDFSTEYRFKQGMKLREEDFGGILFVAPAKWAGVTRDLYHFCQENLNKKFTLDALGQGLGLDDRLAISQTAEFLLKKSIIKKGGEKNESRNDS